MGLPDCPPRFSTPRNPSRETLGGREAQVARALGTEYMPWQRLVADVSMEIDPETGRPWYREVVVVVPRQSGKSTMMLAKAVHRCRGFGDRQNILYAAQTRQDALKKWERDYVVALDASPFGKRTPKPYKVVLANGGQTLVWDNGSLFGIVASTESAGHGSTLDMGIVDEAFKHGDSRMDQAFMPAMVTRTGAQLCVVSTAGPSPVKSPYLWGKVEAGRERCLAGVGSRIAYFEWSAADDMDRADPATWRATMPALGYTITEESVAAIYTSMESTPEEFDRSMLNRWSPGTAGSVIPVDRWREASGLLGLDDPVCFAVDVSPDGEWSSIVAAGRPTDGSGVGVEVVDRARGTGWVVPRLVELAERHRPSSVVFASAGPAIYLASELVDRLGSLVHDATVKEMQAACGGMLADVLEGRLSHRDTAELNTAVEGASRRVVGDAWLWSRRSSHVDISPLVAATLARWGFVDLGALGASEPFMAMFG